MKKGKRKARNNLVITKERGRKKVPIQEKKMCDNPDAQKKEQLK